MLEFVKVIEGPPGPQGPPGPMGPAGAAAPADTWPPAVKKYTHYCYLGAMPYRVYHGLGNGDVMVGVYSNTNFKEISLSYITTYGNGWVEITPAGENPYLGPATIVVIG